VDKIKVYIISSIVTIVLVVGFITQHNDGEQLAVIKPNIVSDKNLTTQLDDMTNDIYDNKFEYQEKFKLAFIEQQKINKKLEDVLSRLKFIESTVEQQSDESENDTQLDVGSYHSSDTKTYKAQSEVDFGNRLDNSLLENDAVASAIATEQAVVTLENTSNINLDDMQCSTNFCRATFTLGSTDKMAIRNLFGQPPFMSDGFTIHDPDGRVKVYFTQGDVSLADLRSEISGSENISE
jgi:hypothetical protein